MIENTNNSLKKYTEIYQKWEETGMLSGLTQSQISQIENNTNFFPPISPPDVNSPTYPIDTNSPILPIATKVATKLIGFDLVSVQPMGGETNEEIAKRESLIRNDKIDALVNEKEFIWKEEYEPKPFPKGDLFYIDFKYETKQKWYTKVWNKLKDLTFLKKFWMK